MALKYLKPTTPSSRGTVTINYKQELKGDKSKKTKALKKPLKGSAGRAGGKVSVRHKERGVKKFYRLIDYRRKIRDIEGKIETIEYDPNRNVFISSVIYTNGIRAYILTPQGVNVGDKVVAGEDVAVESGNAMPLAKVPAGTEVHNIEINPNAGGALVRSAGGSAMVMGFDGKNVQLRLPSKEIRLINSQCYATIGVLSNSDYKNTIVGKAGKNRRRGIRPTVRGMVMPPSAHPHGGGEGKGVIGHVAKDVYGNVRGKKTRRKKHRFTKYILVTRKGKKVIVK